MLEEIHFTFLQYKKIFNDNILNIYSWDKKKHTNNLFCIPFTIDLQKLSIHDPTFTIDKYLKLIIFGKCDGPKNDSWEQIDTIEFRADNINGFDESNISNEKFDKYIYNFEWKTMPILSESDIIKLHKLYNARLIYCLLRRIQ